MMEYRTLGGTKLQVSTLGFGCGAVGGILVKGDRCEMVRAVDRAIELGINYFDTAAIYGDGESETNLGLVLEELGTEVVVGTKVQLVTEELDDIEQAVVNSVNNSLKRLRRDYIDLIQLHNFVAIERRPEQRWVSVEDVEIAMRASERLKEQGKVRFWGFNGLGEPGAVREAMAGNVHTVQTCFNLINPTAGTKAPQGFPFEDYGQLIDEAADKKVGVIAIRVLAGGALSGSASRHPNATQSVDPIASGRDFVEDVALSQRFGFLVNDGYVDSLIEAAIRFAIGKTGVSTALVGISTMEQLEQAAEFTNRGPLPTEALDRLPEVWASLTE